MPSSPRQRAAWWTSIGRVSECSASQRSLRSPSRPASASRVVEPSPSTACARAPVRVRPCAAARVRKRRACSARRPSSPRASGRTESATATPSASTAVPPSSMARTEGALPSPTRVVRAAGVEVTAGTYGKPLTSLHDSPVLTLRGASPRSVRLAPTGRPLGRHARSLALSTRVAIRREGTTAVPEMRARCAGCASPPSRSDRGASCGAAERSAPGRQRRRTRRRRASRPYPRAGAAREAKRADPEAAEELAAAPVRQWALRAPAPAGRALPFLSPRSTRCLSSSTR